MKKLFTLVVAAFAALMVNAEVKDVVTDPITIAAYEGDDGQVKWAESQPIILNSTDVSVNDFLILTITEAEAGDGEQNVLQIKKADGTAMYYGSNGLNPSPNSVVTIPVNQAILDEITSNGFKLGGAVQEKTAWSAVVGKKIVVSKISVQPSSDFSTLELTSKNEPTKAAWKGITIPSANFKLAKTGDLIVFTFTATDDVRSAGNFQFVMANEMLSFYDIPAFYVMTLTDANVKNFNANSSWYYQGGKTPVSATAILYRQKEGLPTVETSVTMEPVALGEWEQNLTLDKEYFANAKAGDEIHLSLKDFQEYEKKGENWTRRGQLQLKSRADNWPAVSGVLDIFNVPNTVFVLTDEQVAAAKEYGLAITGQCLTISAASIFTKDTSSNIANTIAAPVASSSKVYNLAGQQVGASYKGIVVKNGKKFVQK